VNSALWELLLSAVLLLEIPALVSSLTLGIISRRIRPRPRPLWVGLAMLVGLTVPWAGAAVGVLLGLLLSLAFAHVWVPLLAGICVGVLYIQLRWTQLILAEWRDAQPSKKTEAKTAEDDVKEDPPAA